MVLRTRRETALGLALGMCVGACFDSDDKFRVAESTTTGVPATTSTTEPETGTTEVDPTTTSGPPDVTCRDAIGCLRECALAVSPTDPEPDFSCILDCIEDTGLTVNETYKLLKLIECTSMLCEEQMFCEPPMESTSTGAESTSTGAESTTTTDSSSSGSSSSSSSTSGPQSVCGDLLPPCLCCIFNEVATQATPGCEEFHDFCE